MSLGINQPGLTGLTKDLQPASASVLGGVKQGAGTSIAADGTLTVPIVSRNTTRAILQPPGTYNMDGTIGLIQVSLGDGTNITLNLPPSPSLGDIYQIEILITAATTTATVATRSGAIYWGNANISSVKVYFGQIATFYCYDGSGWIGYCTPSDWMTFTPSNFRINGGTGTVALASTQSAIYQMHKNIAHIRFYLTLTITGSPGGVIFDTNLPVPAVGSFVAGTAMGRFMQCTCPAASPAAMYLTPDAAVGAFTAGSIPVNVGSFFYSTST